MKIKVYENFSKRINSTLRPSSSAGMEIDVVLKDDCTIENPVFILSGTNYAINYISAFGKYYFVDKITIINSSMCEYSCVEDVLATAKSQIASTTALILRSTSNYNGELRDDLVSTYATRKSTSHTAFAMPFDSEGCFILSVVNDKSSSTGYVANYVIAASGFQALAKWLSGNGTDYGGDTFDMVSDYLIAQFGDCFECVRGVRWIPIPYATAKGYGNGQIIRVGKYNADAYGYLLNTNALLHDSTSIDLSDVIPGDFRCGAPYTSVDVYLPFYGLVPLNPADCRTSVQVEYNIDLCACDCHVTFYSTGTNHEKMLASVHYDLGVDTPIAQVGRNAVAVTSAAVNTIGAIATQNPLSLIDAGVGLISSVASNGVSQKGALSGKSLSNIVEIIAYVTVVDTTEPDDLLNRYGRPCMEVLTIGNLSGYVQTSGASVATGLTQGETSKINGMLNEGIYYE